jgi:tetratricopeptide (TPR) repeat protein
VTTSRRSRADRPDRLRTAVACALVALLGAAAFFPVVGNGFIDVDDRSLFLDAGPQMQAPPAQAVRWAFTDTSDYWYPLTRLSHAAVARVAGLAPGAHHLASLLLHAGNAALLFLVLRGATGSRFRSLVAASLFAVHPVQTESVAWVVQRSTVLSAFLALLTVAAHVRLARRPTLGRRVAAAAVFTLGLMAKPILVTLPVVLLLWDFWPLGRWRVQGSALAGHGPSAASAPGWRLLAEKAPLLAISAVFSVITVITQAAWGSVRSLGELPLGARLLGLPANYLAYLGKAFLPLDLHPFHLFSPTPPSWGPPLGAALLLTTLTLLSWRLRAERPWLATGWGWFLTILLPVSGLLQVGSQSYAERYAYLSIVGLLVALAWSLPERIPAGGPGRLLTVCLALLVATGAAMSLRQSRHWRTTGTLLTHAVGSDPDNTVVRALRSADSFRRRDFDAAIHDLLFMIPRVASPAIPRFNLALALEARGDLEAALHHLERAAALNPGEAEYRRLLAQWSALRAAAVRDVEVYGSRVRLDPADLEARRELGGALFELGRHEEAARQFRAALGLAPGQPEIAALLERADRHRRNVEEEAFRMRDYAAGQPVPGPSRGGVQGR